VTATIARLILAMLILPATGAVFLVAFLAIIVRSAQNGPPTMGAVVLLWAVVYTFVATYWILLWRSTVRWTRARERNTVLAGVVAIASGIGFAVALVTAARGIPHVIAGLIGGGTVPIVWVLATVLLWRETPAERLARMSNLVANPTVLCPICGYNLSGLREARCPECGGNFTLDELAASQPQRDEHPAEL
jgi:dolichyl-phosphate-mannose--protein O-mannosyl transferase